MKKIIYIFIITFAFVSFFSVAQTAGFQDNVMVQVGAAGSEQGAGLGNVQDPQMFIVNVINIILGAVGIIFTGLIFYGGILFLTAQGEEEKAKKGASIVKASVIGLIIVLASYAISLFVSSMLNDANITENYYI